MHLVFEPLTIEAIDVYVKVGKQSYHEHYLHLWKNRDPSPFINVHLNPSIIKVQLKNPEQFYFLIYNENLAVGILQLTLNADFKGLSMKNNVLLNKVYLLKEYSGQGIGKQSLNFVESFAKKRNKSFVWLYAMKKGSPKEFYKRNGFEIQDEATIQLDGVLDTEKEMWVMSKAI